MALEDSVNDLVTATTDLLNAVNVAKETLDDAVASADVDANAASASAIASANSAASALAIYGNTSVMNAAVASATASAATATTKASEASTSATQAAASASSAAAIVTGVASNRPSIRPSLLLDFANAKQLDPRITFSRASTGTYYDGKTVAKAEENLLTYSQEFDNAIWSKANLTVTANTIAAPDGTTTADTLTDNATSGGHTNRQNISGYSLNTAYTFSAYLQKGTSNYGYLTVFDPATGNRYFVADFDLNAGTVRTSGAGTSGTLTSSSITSVGGGWYRCIITGQLSAGATVTAGIGVSDGTTAIGTFGTIAYSGTGSTIYAWGAQLEQRSTVTAYTPTTTAPITNYIPALQTAAADVARFDHDPITGESKGLLIEEQRTNLVTYSDQFDNAAWTKARSSITSNVVVAPDGTLSGDKLIEDTTASNTHLVQQLVSVVSGTTYTLSAYAKAAERTYVQLVLNGQFSTAIAAIFSLSDGSIGTTAGSPTTSVAYVGNGWYRFSITSTATVTGTTAATVRVTNSSTSGTYTGDGYSGIYIWGAQLEVGSFPTSYIPTVASQVTRSADSASMTGSNFSSWYRADEGTLYGEASTYVVSLVGNKPRLATIRSSADTNLNQNSIGIYRNLTALEASIFTASTSQAYFYGTAAELNNNAVGKSAIAYKTDDVYASFNGDINTTDTAATIPSVNMMDIGTHGFSGIGPWNGHINRIAYYPKRLSNTELQGLTS